MKPGEEKYDDVFLSIYRLYIGRALTFHQGPPEHVIRRKKYEHAPSLHELPSWLLEYLRRKLKSCPTSTILLAVHRNETCMVRKKNGKRITGVRVSLRPFLASPAPQPLPSLQMLQQSPPPLDPRPLPPGTHHKPNGGGRINSTVMVGRSLAPTVLNIMQKKKSIWINSGWRPNNLERDRGGTTTPTTAVA